MWRQWGQPYFSNGNHPHGFLAPNLDPKSGSRFRGGKGNFYEGGLRIPFIVPWPGKIVPGSVSDYLGYFPYVMPTLAELAGVHLRIDTDGLSILPTLLGTEKAGRDQAEHDFLYWEDPKSIVLYFELCLLGRARTSWRAALGDHKNAERPEVLALPFHSLTKQS